MMKPRILCALCLGLALMGAGCTGMMTRATDSGYGPTDPAGTANSGTGSVTSGGAIPAEAKAAGIGTDP